MHKEVEEYMDICKSYENDYKMYSLYVHGYWLPYVEQQKAKGLLKEGR